MILQTSRLILRHIRPPDIPLLHADLFSDTAVMQYAFGGVCFTLQETEAFVAAHAAKAGEQVGIGALVIAETGVLAGFAGLLPCSMEEGAYELGFVLRQSCWGRGYATEIGQGQLVLAEELGTRNVFALVYPQNDASRAVLAKLGMQYEREVVLPQRGSRVRYRKEVG